MSPLSRPGPAITPSEALARIAQAPVIVMLHGTHGACLTWQDQPTAEVTLPVVMPASASDAEPDGLTWGTVPTGAWFVQCDYEFPQRPPLVVRADRLVRWDREGRCTLHGDTSAELDRLERQFDLPAIHPPEPWFDQPLLPSWDADGHRQRIARIKDLIAAGDCYQINLAVAFRGRFQPGPHRDIAAFQALLGRSPAPFAGFFRHPGRPSVVSHSPECLLALRGGRMCSVPIKGTRRITAGVDAAWEALNSSAKDAAELAMIVDLVRNDLGRVAVSGSVRVTDPCLRITLPYVVHRAARVSARLRPGTSAADALLASFPAGSITGAPKRHVMELISSLEQGERGPYCGTFGWMDGTGADLAVAIRTAAITGTDVTLHAGGGIVWDSRPDAEWDEVRAKASAMATAWGGSI